MGKRNKNKKGAGKPVMSKTEASFHETMAGQRASAVAAQQGGNPEHVDMVVEATLPPRMVAGYELKPVTKGTMLTMVKLAEAFEEWKKNHPSPRYVDFEAIENGLGVLVFADAYNTNAALRNGELESLIKKAEAIVWDLPIEQAAELSEHMNKQMQRARQLEDSMTGKSPAAAPQKR